MEIFRHTFCAFDLDEQASLLSFSWTEKSAGMTDEDYKQALREYAGLILKHRARRGLVDLRKFRYHLADADGLASWWANQSHRFTTRRFSRDSPSCYPKGSKLRRTKRPMRRRKVSNSSQNNSLQGKLRFPG